MFDQSLKNLEAIRKGGGSFQARGHEDCPQCHPKTEPETLSCPYCDKITKDGKPCAECLQAIKEMER